MCVQRRFKLGRFFLTLLASALASGLQAAPPAKPAPPLAGHSLHGEAFNEGPRQKAYLMGGTGKVNFPITTKVPEAQAFFNQAVGQLHGFWYFEAERSFRQVAALDPTCPMAYWGMALANVNNTKRAREFIKKATENKSLASHREVLWIDAYARYFQDDRRDDKEHRQDLIRSLEDIIYELPKEVEAKAFLAFQIWTNSAAGIPISSRQAVESLIQEVLAVEPMHPAHHYRIHLWDGNKPIRALTSAARCGQGAPAIAHMWHMPGHTYSGLQRYADACYQQEASARVDHAFMMRDHVLPDQIFNYAHNNQWLVENLEFVGRVHDAVDLAKNMIELPRHPRYNTLNKREDNSAYDQNHGSSAQGRNRLFEVLERFELWDDLIALSRTLYLEPTDLTSEQIKRLRALGVASFSKNDRKRGEEQIAALEALRKKLRAERLAAADTADAKARQEKEPEDKVAKAVADALRHSASDLAALDNALAELRGYLNLARGEKDQANKSFEQTHDIPKERLARFWLKAGDKDKAERFVQEAAGGGANQVHRLANYADILYRLGKKDQARQQFERLREISGNVDLDVPVMQRLAPLAREIKLPADWRIKKPAPTDVGDRPNLAKLGPFRWQPSPAADWTLPDDKGKVLSLQSFRGRPVVLIFYLGHGCPHCIEQLNLFEPLVSQYAAAGITLIAVSTDTVAGLKKTFEKSKLSSDFPLVADPELRVFKAYRAYDDFEKMPLHGTFLIDADGLVRWQDISYEPFKEPKFLLTEAKRLLSRPKGQQTARAGADETR